MKSTLLSMGLLALARVHGQTNDTEPTGAPTLEPTMEVTGYYTSDVILSTQYTLNSSNLSDPRDDGCDYEFMATLNNGEGIVIDICGFTNDAGDAKVDIELMIPTDVWFGVGFSTVSNYDSNDEMANVYAIIVPQNSRDISERILGGDSVEPQAGSKLISTVSLAEDYTEMGMRTLRLQRDATVSLNDLNDDPTTFSDYFDFADFDECDEEVVAIYGFAPQPNEPFMNDADWFETDNSGSVTVAMDEVNGESCVEDEVGDGVERASVVTVVSLVGVAAMMW